MPYRLTEPAEVQVASALRTSVERHGFSAADRYRETILAAFRVIGRDPNLLGSAPIAGVPGLRTYSLRLVRHRVNPDRRVENPRHVVLYRRAADGVVEILGLLHDRMMLDRAARRIVRDLG